MADEKEKQIGRITHYYSKIGVGIIELSGKISVGDNLHFKGNSTDFEEEVKTLQVDHEEVDSAKKGDQVGIKVPEKVRDGDKVYKK